MSWCCVKLVAFPFRVENLSQEVNELQSSLTLKETKWSGRERSYKRTVSELERKVSL